MLIFVMLNNWSMEDIKFKFNTTPLYELKKGDIFWLDERSDMVHIENIYVYDDGRKTYSCRIYPNCFVPIQIKENINVLTLDGVTIEK